MARVVLIVRCAAAGQVTAMPMQDGRADDEPGAEQLAAQHDCLRSAGAAGGVRPVSAVSNSRSNEPLPTASAPAAQAWWHSAASSTASTASRGCSC